MALFGVGVVSRPSRSTGDYNGDGLVTTEDAFDFALAYRLRGEEGPAAPDADLNGDGEVNEMDVFRFLRHWNRDREESLERGVP